MRQKSFYTVRSLEARQKGLEPLTHGLEGRCSVHLSYWREIGASRFERPTPCSQGRCATRLRHAPCFYGLTQPLRALNSAGPPMPSRAAIARSTSRQPLTDSPRYALPGKDEGDKWPAVDWCCFGRQGAASGDRVQTNVTKGSRFRVSGLFQPFANHQRNGQRVRVWRIAKCLWNQVVRSRECTFEIMFFAIQTNLRTGCHCTMFSFLTARKLLL